MGSSTTVPVVLRGALATLLIVVTLGGVLSGPSIFGPWGQGAEAALPSEVKKLLASNPQADDYFGRSVAVSGDTAMVGAVGDDTAADLAGAVYVFARDEGGAGNWGEVGKLTASDAQANDGLGSSVAFSGDTAVVAALGDDAGGSNAGAAYIFGRDQGGVDNWGEVTKLTASDAQKDDQFGSSVALSGDTAVVGASGKGGGAAYVFGRNQGGADTWGEVTKLFGSDVEILDTFGWSVAASAGTVLVGAHGDDDGVPFSRTGAAYVFGRDVGGADNWGEVKKLTASDAEGGDFFGHSLTMSGETAVVGAFHEDSGANYGGAAYVFGRDEGGADNWGEVTKLAASDPQEFDFLGERVAVSGDTAIVGASGKDDGGDRAGAAYVFKLPTPCPDFDGDTICDDADSDDDNDGCSDDQEQGSDETLGGRRDPLYFWDFFDVWAGSPATKDRAVSIGDIGALVARFGSFQEPSPTTEEALSQALTSPPPAPAYHVAYDRGGPMPGQNLWNLLPPDGSINIVDIGSVIAQFGHTCA